MSKKYTRKTPEQYGIVRSHDSKTGEPRWMVSICRQGKSYTKTFQDNAHGGELAALAKAQAHRDALLVQFEPNTHLDFRMIVRSTNQSGIPGVFRGHNRNGSIYYAAYAQMPDGKRRTKSFTVTPERSEAEAFAQAKAAREQMLTEADLQRPMFRTEAAALATIQAKQRKPEALPAAFGVAGQAQAYDANRLMDTALSKLGLKSDAALARVLDVFPPVISKLRHNRIAVGAGILLRLHEATGISTLELKRLLLPIESS